MRQPVDFQLENGIGLVGVEIEARDDLLRRVRLAVRLSHDPEDLVERVEDFLEAVEDVRPLPERLGFTYAVFILTASTDAVTPGGQLSVSWIAPSATHGDWIGLFKVGEHELRRPLVEVHGRRYVGHVGAQRAHGAGPVRVSVPAGR